MKKIFLLFVLLLLLLVSCTKDIASEKPDEVPEEEVPVSDDITPAPETPELPEMPDEPEIDPAMTEISLTTGLPCTPETKASRPIAVMINNNKVSYPQESVSKADIIYECDMEGGVTRLMAIYSQWQLLGNIGSMRSARNYFVDLADSHDAIYVHAGGSPSAYTEIADADIDNVDGVNMYTLPDKTFWRDKDRIRQCGYEHSMMTSGSKLYSAINSLKYRTEYKNPDTYKFNSEFITPNQGELAEKITLVHSNYITVEFIYDLKASRYFKRSFGAEHMDGSNAEQLSFENVVVLFVSESVVDDEGRLDLDLTGEGKGYYFTGGKALEIKWSRQRKGELFHLTLDGGELYLNPGKTHITLFNKNNSKNVIIE
ncbi:MAG: DUF3048 domain-containing protein [Clostridia bacterium]|nr:DUF3048 domain-containing protein [Clostridia bacterium]